MISSSTPTWDDGKPRSMNNAFSVLYEAKTLSAEEKKRIYNRLKKREQYARDALRVNKNTREDK